MSLTPTAHAFWAASGAWWQGRRDAQEKARAAGVLSGSRTGAAKEARWNISGKRYLSMKRGLPTAVIRVDPELTRLVLAQIEAIAPRLVTAFDRRLGRLAFQAWAAWPVASGLSKSLLSLEFEARGDDFRGVLINRAPYVVFINRGATLRDLLRAPGRRVANEIVDDLARSR